MGDIVTCTAILAKSKDSTKPDRLWVSCPTPEYLRILNCRPSGTPVRGERPEYEERDGRLHLQPSLLCSDTGFHTEYNWSVAYAQPESDQYDRFFELNPRTASV